MSLIPGKWLALAPLLLGGCLHYVPAGVSSTSLGPREKVIGTGSGISSSLQGAVQNAIAATGADTMVNVFIDSEWFCFWGCQPTGNVRVFGTLIKYQDAVTHLPLKLFSNPEADLLTK